MYGDVIVEQAIKDFEGMSPAEKARMLGQLAGEITFEIAATKGAGLAKRLATKAPSVRHKPSVGDDLRRKHDLDSSGPDLALERDGPRICKTRGGRCLVGAAPILTASGGFQRLVDRPLRGRPLPRGPGPDDHARRSGALRRGDPGRLTADHSSRRPSFVSGGRGSSRVGV